ncbi:MAG: hypothetical protein KGN79_12575 [Acidobacteriota bacterium]|nr:hypothetical protein [Acidobacteriota bacterium]
MKRQDHALIPARQGRKWEIGRHMRSLMVCSGIVLFVLCAAALDPQQSPNPNRPIHPPILTDPPDANAQMMMRMNKEKKDDFEAANTERRKQLVNDSAKLLELATELKTEMDKTDKDTLSVGVIKKAAEIEKLAHDVRLKMRLVVGQS